MNFTKKKLPPEAAESLKMCPIHTVQPYAPMIAPAYVLMKLNSKFVSVKGPLDFFTPEELERYRGFESLFFTDFVDSSLQFREAARAVRSLLAWKPNGKDGPGIPPAPFETSDAALRIIGPLWADDLLIEPFFVSVFASELCELLPPELLLEARERDVNAYERAMYCSGWAVFVALCLGNCDLGYLNRLRLRVFEIVTRGPNGVRIGASESDALMSHALRTIGNHDVRLIRGSDLAADPGDRIARKLVSRLERIRNEFILPDRPRPTILGERGFLDV